MKKPIIIALLVMASNTLFASEIMAKVNAIESQWAKIYYGSNSLAQKKSYPPLLKHIKNLLKEKPNTIELIIWQAIIISTNAEFESPFSALSSIKKAKKLLESTLNKKPLALEGAAFVVLGTLYNMAPRWPISYGNPTLAEKLLKKGIKANPKSIDANYFYADYLLSIGETEKAKKYFNLAIAAPTRPEQQYADLQLKNLAHTALKHIRKTSTDKSSFFALF